MAARIQITVPSVALTFDKAQLRKALRQAGAEVAAVARSLIRRTKTVSAPGQPPANRTGLLASSIKVKNAKDGMGVVIRDDARSRRGSGAPYALFLEVGARGGVGSGRKGVKGKRNAYKRIGGKNVLVGIVGSRVMPPHPFLSTAADQRADSIASRVRAAATEGIGFQRIKA